MSDPNQQPNPPQDDNGDDEEEQEEEMPSLLPRRKKVRPVRFDETTWKRRRLGSAKEEEEEVKDEGAPEEKQETEEGPEKASKVPPSARSIIENEEPSELVQKNCACEKCRSMSLSLAFPSVGVAAIPTLVCKRCNSTTESNATGTNLPAALRRGKSKATDFAANILCVLALPSSGDGGTEAQRLMGLLGLPHVQSMEKSAFATVKKATAPALWSVANQAPDEIPVEEVKMSMVNDPEFDFDQWEQSVKEGIMLLPDEHPEPQVSMDMGWQKKGSGRRHDSLSGHACLAGMECASPSLSASRLNRAPPATSTHRMVVGLGGLVDLELRSMFLGCNTV